MGFIKILFFCTFAFSKTKLLELSTRQNVHNLKYNSQNGITFYLKGTTALAYSAKNKANVVIENKVDTEFDVVKVSEDQYILSAKTNNFKDLAFIKDAKIYLYSIKSNKLDTIGNGSFPKYHPYSNYLSYVREDNHKLYIEVVNTKNYLDRFSIQLETRELLFRPQVEIRDDSLIYYTDKTRNYRPKISVYNNRSKKNYLIHKYEKTNISLSTAMDKENIYILESIIGPKSYIDLSSFKLGSIDYAKKKPLFNSQFGPAYNLNILNNELFFITTLKSKNSNLINKREVVSYSLNDKKLYKRTDLNYVSSLVIHNEDVFVPYKDKVYLLKDKKGNYSINEEIKSQL